MNKNRFDKVMDFYVITHKLKNLLRTGWVDWGIKADRLESVAEHIYGTQMLAFAIDSEYELGLNMNKVIFMLAFHELGESIIGDINAVKPTGGLNKHVLEEKAVSEILKPLKLGDKVKKLFDEFEAQETKEAKFAKMVDKFECDLQCKFYDEHGCANLFEKRSGFMEDIRQERMAMGDKSFSELWLKYDKNKFRYDELFSSLVDEAVEKNIWKEKEIQK